MIESVEVLEKSLAETTVKLKALNKSGLVDAGAKAVGEKMMEITGQKPFSVLDISPAIGLHAGKGAIAIALLFNNCNL